jgi:hypothetical protein
MGSSGLPAVARICWNTERVGAQPGMRGSTHVTLCGDLGCATSGRTVLLLSSNTQNRILLLWRNT